MQNLPHQLISAFAATLEETALADVLLHAADAANPECARQIDNVDTVLAEIGADRIPQILVYNKTDLLPQAERRWGSLKNREGKTVAVGISAATGEGLDALRQAIAEYAAGFPEE